MHDEISGWVSTEGEEMVGLLEERWRIYDDSNMNGSEFIDEKGILVKKRKGESMSIDKILNDKYHILLPEYYLRPNEIDDFINNINYQLEDF